MYLALLTVQAQVPDPDALYRQRPDASEGDLSRLRAHLVREAGVAEVARGLNLGDYLIVGAGEAGGGTHRRQSLLADVLEAVLGAVFLDGGIEKAREVTLRLYAEALANLPDAETLKDAKTRLQEYLQGRNQPLPRYDMHSVSGPQHEQRQQKERAPCAESRQARRIAR